MSFTGFMFRQLAGKGDAKRDANLKEPADVTAEKNINYARNQDSWNLLDIYYPRGTKEKVPVIWSGHGGGDVYGTKEDTKI